MFVVNTVKPNKLQDNRSALQVPLDTWFQPNIGGLILCIYFY